MPTLFDAIDIAKRSLMAQQWAMNTAMHNTANVNTPGYTRQRADMEAFTPAHEYQGQFFGMGSDVVSITRMRNQYLDRMVLAERENQGFLDFQNTALAQVETILGETSGYGVSGVLDEFWSAWSDLANDPENSSSRTALKQKGEQLGNTLNELYDDLKNQQRDLDSQLSSQIYGVNSIAAQIASLNNTISNQVNQGMSPNDLMDQRDLLVGELSKLVDIETQYEASGDMTIWLGGQILVYDDTAKQLQLQEISGDEAKLHNVVWAHNGSDAAIRSGEIAALMLVRDEVIPELINELDEFTNGLVNNLNAIHITGYGLDGSSGNNFFDPSTTGAKDIALSAEILQSSDKIAASSDGTPGNNDIALEIYNLQNELVMENGTTSIGGYYSAIAADLGALKQTAQDELNQSE
ncbi:flagellar hook-associated protein FlgK, partial [bacterium]|nr:flagellar hook-associated protein FlgK [bacterium]